MFRCHVVFAYFCANKLHQNVNIWAVFLFIHKSDRSRLVFFKVPVAIDLSFCASVQVVGFISLLIAAE